MKIIKRVEPPKSTTYYGKCGICTSEIECLPHELHKHPIVLGEAHDPQIVEILPACPVCFAVFVPMYPELRSGWVGSANYDGVAAIFNSPSGLVPPGTIIDQPPLKVSPSPEKPKRKR